MFVLSCLKANNKAFKLAKLGKQPKISVYIFAYLKVFT